MNQLTLSQQTIEEVASRLQAHFALRGQLLETSDALEAAHAVFEYQSPDSLTREVSRDVFQHYQPEIARKVSLLVNKARPLCGPLLGYLAMKVGMPGKQFCFEVVPASVFEPLQIQASISLEIGYGNTAEALLALQLKVSGSKVMITPIFQCMTHTRNYVDVRRMRIGQRIVELPGISIDLDDSKACERFEDFLGNLAQQPLQKEVLAWYDNRNEDGSDD